MPRYPAVVRIFSPTGGRRAFPANLLSSVEWGDDRFGGWSDFSISTNAQINEIPHIETGDIVEIFVTHEGTAERRYRGEIRVRQSSEGEPSRLQFTGFGKYLHVGRQIINQQIAEIGSPDISVIFAKIAAKAITPVFPTLHITAAPVGIVKSSIEAFNRPAQEVFDELVTGSGNRAVWGIRAESDGRDWLHFGPINSGNTPDYTLPIPSRRGASGEAQYDTSDIRNEIHVIGGAPRYENGIFNADFRFVDFNSADTGNILIDPGFNDRSASWNLSGGASFKAGGLSEGPAYEGDDMVELDNTGETVKQTRNNITGIDFVEGHTWSLGLYVKREHGGTASTGIFTLKYLNTGGGTISTYEVYLAPESTSWSPYTVSGVCPAGCTGIEWKVSNLTGSILVDGASAYNASLRAQRGWAIVQDGAGNASIRDWASENSPRFGAYCVYLKGHAENNDGNDVHLVAGGSFQATSPVTPGGSYRLFFYLRCNVDGSGDPVEQGAARLELHERKQDGTPTGSVQTQEIYPAGTSWEGWQQFSKIYNVGNDCYAVTPCLTFRGDFDIYVDGAALRDSAAPEMLESQRRHIVIDPEFEFIPDGPYQGIIRVTDAMAGGDPEYTSIDDFGLWPYVENVNDVTDQGTLLDYARAYFPAHAIGKLSGAVSRIGDTRYFKPGQALALAGPDGKLLSSIPRPIVGVRWSYGGGNLSCRLEFGDEFRNPEVELKRLIDSRAKRSGSSAGSGGSSYSSPGNTGNTGGGSGGGLPAPTPTATDDITGTVKTDIPEADPTVYTKTTVDALHSIGYNPTSYRAGLSSQTTAVRTTAIGAVARAFGYGATAVGDESLASSDRTTAIGDGTNASALAGTAVGWAASAGFAGTALGDTAAAGSYTVSLGHGSNSSAGGICIGPVTTSAFGEFVAGSGYCQVRNIYFGIGQVNAASGAASGEGFSTTYHASGGDGTNIGGANIRFAGGRGTGSAPGGDVILSTAPAGSSGTSLNSLVDWFRIKPSGHAIQPAPASAPVDADIANNQICITVDESARKILFRIRLSTGAYEDAEVPFL